MLITALKVYAYAYIVLSVGVLGYLWFSATASLSDQWHVLCLTLRGGTVSALIVLVGLACVGLPLTKILLLAGAMYVAVPLMLGFMVAVYRSLTWLIAI